MDLAHYRSVLKNKGIVDEAEKILREFKPITYDVSTHVKAIETFETKAVCLLPGLLPTPAPRFRVFQLPEPASPIDVSAGLIDCQGKGNRSAD